MTEDKVTLTRQRAELVARLSTPMSTEALVQTQAQLSLINAKLKVLNTTEAARQKAEADRRKVAGLEQARADAARALAKVGGPLHDVSQDDDHDDDPGQTAAVDGWVDAVLLRHDIDSARDAKGRVMVTDDPHERRPPMPQNLAAAIELLVAGVYAAARGQELPDLPPNPPVEGRYVPKTKPKAKPKKR
jgi:hypothetical protein